MRPRSRCPGRTAFRFWSFRSTMTGPSPRSSAVAAGPQSSAMRTGDIVADPDIEDVQKRMEGALAALRSACQGLSAGRASIGLQLGRDTCRVGGVTYVQNRVSAGALTKQKQK